MTFDDRVIQEVEKLEQRFLDLKMEFMLEGWSTRFAYKTCNFKKEADEFNKFLTMMEKSNNIKEEDMDT